MKAHIQTRKRCKKPTRGTNGKFNGLRCNKPKHHVEPCEAASKPKMLAMARNIAREDASLLQALA